MLKKQIVHIAIDAPHLIPKLINQYSYWEEKGWFFMETGSQVLRETNAHIFAAYVAETAHRPTSGAAMAETLVVIGDILHVMSDAGQDDPHTTPAVEKSY